MSNASLQQLFDLYQVALNLNQMYAHHASTMIEDKDFRNKISSRVKMLVEEVNKKTDLDDDTLKMIEVFKRTHPDDGAPLEVDMVAAHIGDSLRLVQAIKQMLERKMKALGATDKFF